MYARNGFVKKIPRFARNFYLGFTGAGLLRTAEIEPAGCALQREHRFQLRMPLLTY